MPALINNRYWIQRNRSGRTKRFTSPDAMWSAACEYFQWCEDNPLTVPDRQGKIEAPRPFSLHGLCLYLNCNQAYFRQLKKTCSEDFLAIIDRIEMVIFVQQFEGAAVGIFNQRIIARKLGLTTKTERKKSAEVKPGLNLTGLFKEELYVLNSTLG
jgi:hypothetical protein